MTGMILVSKCLLQKDWATQGMHGAAFFM